MAFFATSHGKGPCDGVGGTVKRKAYRASLRNLCQITSPRELFDWATKSFENIDFAYCSKETLAKKEKKLNKRFEKAVTIVGTQKFHAFIPLNIKKMMCKEFSAAKNFTTAVVCA